MSHFLSQYWWAITLSAIAILWTWRAVRRSLQIRPPAIPTRPRPPTPGFRPYLHRASFAAQAEAIRRQMVRGVAIALTLAIIGFPLAFMLVARVAGFGQRSFETLLVGVCFGGVLAMLVFAFRGGQRMRRTGLVCPACRGELVGTNQAGAWLQDRVLETGLCPHCQTPLLDPSEVGPVPTPTLSLSGHLGAIGLIVAMSLSIVGVLYFGSSAVRTKRWAYCARRYARAQTAADTASVDTVSFKKTRPTTCGDLRAGR